MSETITWNSAHGFDCSACGHSQHPCEHWKIFVATASKGQRCCEQGNFGELHDCAKGQSAESTASNRQAFEEWWRSEGCTHLPAASEPPQHAYVAQKAWQARGASEYERGRRDRRLTVEQVKACLPCSSSTQSDDEWWNAVTANLNHALAATSGTPAEHNPARAPHNKFASLWCDACPRPASGTPTPQGDEIQILQGHANAHANALDDYFAASRDGRDFDWVEYHRAALKLTGMIAAPPPADETLPAGAPVPPNPPLSLSAAAHWIRNVYEPWFKRAAQPSRAQGEGLTRQALELARDEVREMMLAQTAGNPPRNPELTKAAYKAINNALAAAREPAAPRFGALKAKRDYPQHWDVATCISAHLEEEGLIKIGLEGVRAQEIVRRWLAAQEKP